MRDHGGDLDRAKTHFGGTDWIDLSTGLTVSTLALAFLHFRWRKKEAHDMTPDTIEDTFS